KLGNVIGTSPKRPSSRHLPVDLNPADAMLSHLLEHWLTRPPPERPPLIATAARRSRNLTKYLFI
ncbi:hypothetical protein FS837_008097, partial [Tulasnella sp. UAMH 9824]